MTLFRVIKFVLILPLLWACVKADKHDSSMQGNLIKADLIGVEKFEARNILSADPREAALKDKANFPNHITYYLKLCLTDIASRGTLQGHTFKIQSELDQDKAILVAADSCLHWQESISFDYFAASKDLEVNYKISSSKNLGTLVKKVIFNPWNQTRDGEKGFIDISNYQQEATGNTRVKGKEEITKALSGETDRANAGALTGELSMSGISLFPTEREKKRKEELEKFYAGRDKNDAETRKSLEKYIKDLDGVHLDLNMQMNPFVWINSINGGKNKVSINRGRFHVFANVVAKNTDKNGSRYILNQDLSQFANGAVWNMDIDGSLNVSMPLVLRAESNYGDLSLAVKIIPLDLGPNVKPFTAVYKLGTYAQFTSKQSGFKDFACCSDKNQDGKLSYDEYLQTASNYKEFSENFKSGLGIKDSGTLRASERFLFQEMKVLFARVLPNETATDRTVQYTAKSCVINRITGSNIGMGSEFKITTEDSGKKLELNVKTDQDGCLNWFGLISHKYYHKEAYIRKTATIEYLDNKREKPIVQSLEYFINPWDEKFTFGRDARTFPKELIADVESQQKNAPPSRFFISDFNYTTLGFRYEIDKYMNLKVKKAVILTLHPHVLKYNSIVGGRNGTYALRDGIYLLKVALQKYYLDPAEKGVRLGTDHQSNSQHAPTLSMIGGEELKKKQYISSQTVLVRVLNGMINSPVEFEIDDLRLMRIREQFFVQLQTIDENRLKLATQLDEKLKAKLGDLPKGPKEVEKKISIAFEKMDKIDEINKQIDKMYSDSNASAKLVELAKQKDLLNEELGKALGVSAKNKKTFDSFVNYMNEFRSAGANAQSTMRNNRRQVIDKIINAYKTKVASLTADKKISYSGLVQELNSKIKEREKLSDEQKMKLPALEDLDPIQVYYHLTSGSGEYNELAMEKVVKDLFSEEDKKQIEGQDFTIQSLQPTYNFELLTNDDPKDEDFSGLSKRTFMGPVTFLLNGNGSPVRPTDILNESVCPTATCASAQRIEKSLQASNEMGGMPIDNLSQSNYVTTQKPEDIQNNYQRMTEVFGNLLNNKMEVYDIADSVNKNYESNPYYGSASGFLGISVDDLIKEERKIKKYYSLRMYLSSQLGNFLNTLNLNYVSVNDDVSRVNTVDGKCLNEIKDFSEAASCVKKGNKDILSSKDWTDLTNSKSTPRFGLTPYWSLLNSWTRTNVQLDKEHLNKIISEPNGIKTYPANEQYKMLEKICGALVDNFYSQELIDLAKTDKKNLQENAHDTYKKCADFSQSYVQAQDQQANPDLGYLITYPPIVFERKIRVYDTTKRYMYKEGKSLNINIGANFSLSHSDGFGTSTGAGLRPLEFVEKALPKAAGSKLFNPELSAKAAKAVGDKISSWYNVVSSAFSLNTSISTGESMTRSDGTSVSEGTFLVSQMATFDIEIGKHEKCVIVRLSPYLLKGMRDSVLTMWSADQRSKVLSAFEKSIAGTMICSGVPETKPLPVKERYYYFTQHFTEGDMLDTGDLFNHPWLLQMRGIRDYRTFVGTIRATKNRIMDMDSKASRLTEGAMESVMSNNPFGAENKKVSWEILREDQYAWPLEMLGAVYFNVQPTYPAMYTFIDDPNEQVTNWPYQNTDPKTSFESLDRKD